MRPSNDDDDDAPALDRVLVVDDDALIRRMLGRALQGSVAVTFAPSVQDGLRHIQSFVPWAAFLFDVHLGDGLGWELLDAVRASHAHVTTPVIMMSAASSPEAAHAMAVARKALFVPKTFTASELRAIVRAAIDSG
jgi:DNA-binding response OmpR family regulator